MTLRVARDALLKASWCVGAAVPGEVVADLEGRGLMGRSRFGDPLPTKRGMRVLERINRVLVTEEAR